MVIASQCLEYMSVTDLAEVENAINNAIKNSRERTRKENLERIRYLLELINCGFDIDIIIPNVLPFL